MHLSSRLAIPVLLLVSFSCSQQPSAVERQWFKGNLHTHSYWSDGDEFPEVIMAWYKSQGYDFVALSDHNILADGEKWVSLREDAIYQDAFQSYLEEYGEEWVNYREDTSGLAVQLKTLEEYRGRFEEPGEFLIIQSQEITDRYDRKPIHLNATNIQEKIEPQGGNSVSEVLQNNIDAVIDQREATGTPMIPHVNHPNFGYALTLEDMVALSGERFFEVYNGHPQVHNMGDSTHMSTEEMWDRINRAYIAEGKPIMYGLATDDSHHYHNQGKEWSNAGRGWIMVQAETLGPASIIEAMEAGNFYATTGVAFNDISSNGNTLSVSVKAEPGVNYTVSFIGWKRDGAGPEVLSSATGTEASFQVTDEVLFVRCKVTSSKLHVNPIEDLLYEAAWTQPVVANP